MKQNIKTFLFAALLIGAYSTGYAQDNNREGRPSHEEMVERQASDIATQMGLDEKTTKKFLSVYKSEQSDMMELMPRPSGRPPRGERPEGNPPQGNPPQGNPPADAPSGDMQQNGEHRGGPQMSEEDQKKMEEVKTKYRKKYSKFLSDEQIEQVYKLQQQQRDKHRPGGKQ